MVYSFEVTIEHPLAEYFTLNLNQLVKSDGGKGVFPAECVAISIDNVERSIRRAEQISTVDIAIGVIARTTYPQLRNKRMLMCEFRFNYKNAENISKTALEDKISNSQRILRDKYEGLIDQKCYFLFDKKIISQAINRFSRIYNTRTTYRIATTEEEFNKIIF
ncbi:MAG: hypothetical protein VB079_00715 [Petrimonas sp.]|jgi:hypothetical protein|nr:hypothetical protein [Dysgonamonadaceae bacterium]MDD4697118.1 hypothetical protein [Fermentimonas sp.]MEA4994991.1 hypothetical protein [Petrimonas sp.]MDD3310169.1 hypothetical protein [Dysgonamonadaceae bacterium]MDD3901648.1 hypothetical protein [Dysgonamonadaceae bacterium]